MKEEIVVIADSTKLASRTYSHLYEHFKDKDIYIISMQQIGLYEFTYPRKLKLTDFPYISDPEWQQRILGSPVVFKVCNTGIESSGESFSTLLSRISTIKYLGTPYASSGINFNLTLHKVLGSSLMHTDYPAFIVTDLSIQGIKKALQGQNKTSNKSFENHVAAGLAKKYFDYNFNINSIYIFSIVLRDIGVDTNRFILTKYALQMLYDLRTRTKINISDFLKRTVVEWPGSGKYKDIDQPITKIGSITSFIKILDNLSKVNLIQRENNFVSITNSGRELLVRLHPDCCDTDLPFRLFAWQEDWPNSKPKIDRYLRTLFGKQKRFYSSEMKNNMSNFV